MPQLDKVTFLSQIFWLSLLFLTFYVLLLKYFLPNIVINLKIRKKTINHKNKQLNNLKGEEKDLLLTYDKYLSNSFIESRKLLSNTIDLSNEWLIKKTNEINSHELLNANKLYLFSIANLNKEQLAFKKII